MRVWVDVAVAVVLAVLVVGGFLALIFAEEMDRWAAQGRKVPGHDLRVTAILSGGLLLPPACAVFLWWAGMPLSAVGVCLLPGAMLLLASYGLARQAARRLAACVRGRPGV
ncbi:hypothetical protein ACWEQL_12525 [Kitasatospora sp. NPDC004240]